MDNYEQSLEIEFRKQEGIFYSPNTITQYIVNEAFSLIFAGQKTCKGLDFEKVQNLKILDPSCGTGIFLEESLDFLLHFYQKYFPNFPNPAKWIVENNLYGVDLDGKAVQICQKRLF